ncbi:MAG: spondin domain-containing protein, partial [Gemmatimonadota bacterium]
MSSDAFPDSQRRATRRGHRFASFALTTILALGLAACDDDEDSTGPDGPATSDFVVRIENVDTADQFVKSGTFNTGVVAGTPGAILPGDAFEFSFTAPTGASLSFATMFVPSNDFFFAPDGDGIELFDGTGTPVTGDVTSQILLWDAGTEVNQEPGTGADQVQRQAAPNTGAADGDNTVRLAPDDFSNLPAVSDVIEVTISSDGPNSFTVRIENVSTATTLTTSTDMQAVPLSPGAWVVHTAPDPLFTVGSPDFGEGLEGIAEDGDPAALGTSIAANTGITIPLSPGVWAVHTGADPLYTLNSPDFGAGLEAIAEDGDPSALAASLGADGDIESSGAFTTPVGASAPGAAAPGQAFEFTISAEEGDKLSLATMFVQSNDLFFAPSGAGIDLFSAGTPVSGNVTSQVFLYDAGTEVNEEPGIGPNQVQRQAAV